MPDLAELQLSVSRHQLIVQAKLDGYDVAVCPYDGDLWISFPSGVDVPKGLRSDDLFEHPETRGKGCEKPEAPYVPLTDVWEDAAILAKVLETLEDEKTRRSAKEADPATS